MTPETLDRWRILPRLYVGDLDLILTCDLDEMLNGDTTVDTGDRTGDRGDRTGDRGDTTLDTGDNIPIGLLT